MADPTRVPRGERFFLLALLAGLGFVSYLVLRPYLGWVLLALFLGYAAFPLRNWLMARRVPKWLAAAAITTLVTALALAPIAFIAWQLADEVTGLLAWIGSRGPDFFVRRIAADVGVSPRAAESIVSGLEGGLATVAARALEMVDDIAVGSVLAFFLLFSVVADGDRLVGWFRDSAPLSRGRREILATETTRALDAVLLGVFAVAIVQGITAGVGWWLFGLPDPLFWGFVLIVASLVPYLGAHVVLVPAGLWLIGTGDVPRGVGVVLFSLFVVGTVDNVVRPILIGRRARIHPAVVLVGVIGGIPAFGAIGVVLGPVALALLIAVVRVVARPEEAEAEGRAELEDRAMESAARMIGANETGETALAAQGGAEDDVQEPGAGRPS